MENLLLKDQPAKIFLSQRSSQAKKSLDYIICMKSNSWGDFWVQKS